MLHHSGPAQLTWLSGVLLLALIYWVGADIYLIDNRVFELTRFEAVSLSAGSLVIGWLAYHFICNTIRRDRVLFGLFCIALLSVSWVYFQIFSTRAALLHLAALLGTIMSMNVVFVIVPCHIGMRNQLENDETIDKALALRQQNMAVFSVRVLPVRKAPCAGNGRSPWQARQRRTRASRERPSGGSVSAPGPRCASQAKD